ncbi:lipopolysaccharide assembly protein LapA domain-containing protein [Pontivivens ytuae]|uniref:DUF1049 domain-containing protein n=1 Tax=Pontivivens ytuae TaxID=2789856 RepID=A0A7S9LU94_9RHOB|nr:lipopolysaccharide assembly protein LapA domain-containing protein [Pontivivens ytuae]QPH55234.1 DUF1049 domain-containing protein [Pontivivens ytuae]
MRVLKMILLLALAVIIIMLAVANREPVVVELLPTQFQFITGWSTQVPLFVVMIVMAAGGFTLGWSWEWLREQRTRTIAARRRRQIAELEAEVQTLRKDTGREEDEVLALLK